MTGNGHQLVCYMFLGQCYN